MCLTLILTLLLTFYFFYPFYDKKKEPEICYEVISVIFHSDLPDHTSWQ